MPTTPEQVNPPQNPQDPSLRPSAPEPDPIPKTRIERAIQAFFQNAWQWGLLYLLIASAFGLALWPLSDIEAIRYIVKNDLTVPQRYQVLLAVTISIVLTTAGYLLVWLRNRRQEPGLGVVESFRRTNRVAYILLLLPMIAALAVVRIETKHPNFTGFLLVLITAIFMPWLYARLRRWIPADNEPFQPARRPGLARGLFIATLLGYTGLIGAYTLIDHRNLGTAIYDLGIYDNLVWQTAHGNFLDCTLIKGGNHISAHFDPILALVALIYSLYQHAETLLVLQTVWLASGMIPLYLLAKRRLHNEWFAAILTLIYALYPALHGVNMFDFHSLALIVPNLIWAVYLLDTGGYKRYWLVLALLLITREDISLLACFIGAYAILSGRTRTGLATIFVSAVYLTLVKLFAMADSSLLMASKASYSYVYYYDDMIPHSKEGVRGLVITTLVNPLYALQVAFKEEKLLFFLHLLLPLLCLPFAAGRKLILSVYGLIFIGLASRKHVFSLHFQYSALLFPMLFAAVPDGLVRVVDSRRLRALGLERGRLAWTLVLGMLASTLTTSIKYGVVFPNAAFKTGWNRLVRIPTQDMRDRYARVLEIVERVGPDAALSLTSEVGPHLSNRRKAYHWPTVNDADYLVLGVRNFKKEDEKKLKRLKDKKQFRLIDEAHGIALYERIEEGDVDAEDEDDKAKSQRSKSTTRPPRPAVGKTSTTPTTGSTTPPSTTTPATATPATASTATPTTGSGTPPAKSTTGAKSSGKTTPAKTPAAPPPAKTPTTGTPSAKPPI
ncbi:MAG: DUF2079 domain-containing protein [Myxococcales bacterium]|nr:DUF2079 domain-containing protein [Myxococcales bacterium]